MKSRQWYLDRKSWKSEKKNREKCKNHTVLTCRQGQYGYYNLKKLYDTNHSAIVIANKVIITTIEFAK